MPQRIFTRNVSAPRMLLLLALAVGLMVIDQHTTWLAPARAWMEDVGQELARMAGLVGRAAGWSRTQLAAPATLAAENQQLHAEILVLKGQIQQLAALSAENTQLRALLSAAPRPGQRLLMAQLISVAPDPMRHLIHIDHGSSDGVFVGQAVIDATGLMGQVIEVGEHHAEVLLISDERHAVPVAVAGSGVHAIAEGIGDYHRLRLRHVSPTLDVAMQDLLVTSGLGGRFPPGYPVGRITAIAHERGQAFVEVSVEPAARLDRSRQLLLVFPDAPAAPNAPAAPAAAVPPE